MESLKAREEDEDKGQLLLDMLQNSFATSKFTGKSVWVGVLTSGGAAMLAFVVFCFLRTPNTVTYAPKTRVSKYQDSSSSDSWSYTSMRAPPRLSPGPFRWIIELYRFKESDLLFSLGIDMVVCLKFLRMNMHIFSCLAFLGLTVAVPVNVSYSLRNTLSKTATASDAFILMTPTLVSGNAMIAHVVLAYVFDAIVLFFLWKNFREIVALREIYFMSSNYRASLAARSLLLTELPKRLRSDPGILDVLGQLGDCTPITQVSIGRSVKGMWKIIRKREESVFELEKVLAKYFKNAPDSIPSKKPMMKPYKDDCDRYDEKTKVDSINYLMARIRRLEDRIVGTRKNVDSLREMPYGFAAYNTIANNNQAALAARHRRFYDSTSVHLACQREDIIWDGIELSRGELLGKRHSGTIFFTVLCAAWIIPNAFIGTFLSQISRIGVLWDSFGDFMDRHQNFFSFVQGFLSPLVTSLLFMILPVLMRRMSEYQGAFTKSSRERKTLRKLYIFFVFNNLFVFTIFGVAWSAITQIIQLTSTGEQLSTKEVIHKLGLAKQISSSILGISSFWVMYLVRVHVGASIDLLKGSGMLIQKVLHAFHYATPRQMIEWTEPPTFDFASHYNWTLFYATIALTFTTIQPLILVVAAFFFALDTFLKKYSLVYVFVPKVESYGSFWTILFDRMIFALLLGNLVMLLVTWTQGGWKIAVSITPLFGLVLLFKLYCYYKFSSRMKYNMCSIEGRAATGYGDDTELTTIYTSEELNASSVLSSSSKTDTSIAATVTSEPGDTAPDLRIEFGNPALYRRLVVPMVKRSAVSALDKMITDQRIAQLSADDSTVGSGSRVGWDSSMAGMSLDGVFEIVDESDLDIVKFQTDQNFRPSDDQHPEKSSSFFDRVTGRSTSNNSYDNDNDEEDEYNPDPDDPLRSYAPPKLSFPRIFRKSSALSSNLPSSNLERPSPAVSSSINASITRGRASPPQSFSMSRSSTNPYIVNDDEEVLTASLPTPFETPGEEDSQRLLGKS
ncbi:uncharacterized protein V1516DRAFT_668757 [Lipomyces oligophaga]|uniref:uncharacterized protein n=1 Tax=Lipomyces oligophaga TaxID=45792 RepID=UPI0034CD470C